MGYLKVIIPIIIVIMIGSVMAFNFGQETIEEEIVEKEEWISSGPFSIEKSEYYLGEKIFLNVRAMPISVNGEILVLRPTITPNIKEFESVKDIPKELISTKTKYLGIEFDGKSKENFNRYFEPKLSKWKNICSSDELTGEWVMIFSGTEYKPIFFEVTNEIAPWYEKEKFEPIC
jgi:hypothetical protein